MSYKISIIVFISLLVSTNMFAQTVSSKKSQVIAIRTDTIVLDTLSILPQSLSVYTKMGDKLDTAYYTLNAAQGLLIVNRNKLERNQLFIDSIRVNYQTFAFNFSVPRTHKDISYIKKNIMRFNKPFFYNPDEPSNDIFGLTGLTKSGSISRGISFGNNQDAVVNSSLNLQLAGKLNDNVDILMAATDENIPIQPDGNTQQLQEFDKVFIQLSRATTKLIAGDFVLARPNSYFMNFNKRSQGISASTEFKTTKSKDKTKTGLMRVKASAAVSKGKFARNLLDVRESNQGPYRLRGAENELYIIVLSGSELVYMDGVLLKRGQENDYLIDYNTAEITFTPRQKITKDKRVSVEFQYSDKNYARSLFYVGDEFEKGKLRARINFYSEQDSKNKPLQQQLNDKQKLVLAEAGDELDRAIIPSADSVAFNSTEVLYRKKDTLVGTHSYAKIYAYSNIDTLAYYRLAFSFVGLGKGNYRQVNSTANGKVFEWVVPDTLTGLPRGDYEPIQKLISPKKKQLLTSAFEYDFTKDTRLFMEAALSNNDINLFAKKDKENDNGLALKMAFETPLFQLYTPTNDTVPLQTIKTNLNYEVVQRNFSPIERYRTVEFDRDWNRINLLTVNDQHIIGAALFYTHRTSVPLGYRFNTFFEGDNYQAFKHNVLSTINWRSYFFNADVSTMNAATQLNNSQFMRARSELGTRLKRLTLGTRVNIEHNLFKKAATDSTLLGSYQFNELEAYLTNPDSAKNRFALSYKQRDDKLLKGNKLAPAMFAQNISFTAELNQYQNNQLKFNATYRNLKIYKGIITAQQPDNSVLGRIEDNLTALKGILISNTYYEIGSGLELKKEFMYVEVPARQGVYAWMDYNNNGIKELNEFEIAAFPDQAKYIKVYTPTNDYVKTYTNQFSQVLTLRPAVLWINDKGLKKFIALFSDQIAYRADRKSGDNNLLVSYNPFLKNPNDSLLIALNSSVRNTVYFNQTGLVFGLDYSFQDNRNKILLSNGFDSKTVKYHEVNVRWNINRAWDFQQSGKTGIKSSKSLYFSTRDYLINYMETEPKLSWQPLTTIRISLIYKYSQKHNSQEHGGQTAVLNNIGTETKYNVLEKGSLLLRVNFIGISFNDSPNTSLAFEMLEGLKTGNNATWGLSYQRNLGSNMQLSLTYDGRKSEGVKTIHTGGAQVRAFF